MLGCPSPLRASLLALSLALLAGASAPLAAQAASLAGLWRYSAENSDQGQPGALSEGTPGGFPGGRGPGGGNRGGPRGRRGGDSAAGAPQLMGYLRPVLLILIREDDSTVAVSDANGQMQTFHPDGRKLTETLLDGTETETVARWKDGRLMIERKLGDAGSVKESYGIDPLSSRLLVLVRVSGGGFPKAIELRRAYDPAKGS